MRAVTFGYPADLGTSRVRPDVPVVVTIISQRWLPYPQKPYGLHNERVRLLIPACDDDMIAVFLAAEAGSTWYKVAGPRVADLVVLARSMAADNAAALAACVHIAPAPDGEAGP